MRQAAADAVGQVATALTVEADAWRLLREVVAALANFEKAEPEAGLGDYLAGPSHTLPTGGTARMWSGIGADTATGGVRLNMIPREGGNRFSGDVKAAVRPGDAEPLKRITELEDRSRKASERHYQQGLERLKEGAQEAAAGRGERAGRNGPRPLLLLYQRHG